MNLQEFWAVTTKFLQGARAALGKDLTSGSDEQFLEYLEHNELELALDELEGLAEVNDCPPEFWQNALLAAENMNLESHSARYRSKLNRSRQ